MKAFAVLGFIASAAAQLVTTGASFKLGDIYYYVSPYSQGKAIDGSFTVKNTPQAFGFTPVTVISDNQIKADTLPALFGNWTTKDDVFQSGFLSTIILAGHSAPCVAKEEIFHDNITSLIVPYAGSAKTPSGPYFLEIATGEIYQAYRLYLDYASAFSESLFMTPEETFQPLSAQIPSSNALAIGVPSRLYSTPTAEKPLAGVRLGVKDIYDLAGSKRSNGNRAWWHLYPAAKKTAISIQNLIDAGAIVVGYQKTSQFANGETPTADWVSQLSPFNPRGDGQNAPGSSSSGAGASVGSYPWIDIAIGSDTGGSIRSPANNQGIFGNRPSHGLVSLENVMPLSPTLDTPGFLVRDPAIWDVANKALYGTNYTSFAGGKTVKYPKTIYAMGFPSSSNSAAGRILNNFTSALAAFIGTEVTPFNLTTAWDASRSSRPSSLGDTSLINLLNTTYATLLGKEQIKLLREPFYADYAAAHQGRRPFINPATLARWDFADSVPDSWHADAIRNKTIFMDWFNTEIVARADDDAQCTESIILYPGATGVPNPRNRYGSAPTAPLGFPNGRISVFAEIPDNVFPLGEVPVASSITGQDELLPVSVNIMVAKGCDGLIVRLAQDLLKEGILTIPKTGRTLTGGDVLFKRDALDAWF